MATIALRTETREIPSQGRRYRGLFLVPKGATPDLSRGEASEDVCPMDSLEHARRIVEQVEREIAQKAARERTLRMQLAPVPAMTRPGFWTRAARAMGL